MILFDLLAHQGDQGLPAVTEPIVQQSAPESIPQQEQVELHVVFPHTVYNIVRKRFMKAIEIIRIQIYGEYISFVEWKSVGNYTRGN